MTDARLNLLTNYVKEVWPQSAGAEFKLLNGDASLRRYFRVKGRIAVDAPPESQKTAEFVDIATRLTQMGVRVPKIYAADVKQGLMLIEDVGDRVFAGAAQWTEQERYYLKAVALLPQLAVTRSSGLPRFDKAFMLQELEIMRQWLLQQALGMTLTDAEEQVVRTAFEVLTTEIERLPYCTMHRDFHCRNLQVLLDESLCVLDFQDMVVGPCGYDVASLVYDCYVMFPQALVDKLLALTWRRYIALGLIHVDLATFSAQVQLISLQRHLKVLGIFNRLYLRDGKRGYLRDLPRVLTYTLKECAILPELQDFSHFMHERVAPTLNAYLQREGIKA